MSTATLDVASITMSRDAFHAFATDAGYGHLPVGPAAGAWDYAGRRYYSDRYARAGRELTITTDAATGVILYGEQWTADAGTDWLGQSNAALTRAVLADWRPVSLVKS